MTCLCNASIARIPASASFAEHLESLAASNGFPYVAWNCKEQWVSVYNIEQTKERTCSLAVIIKSIYLFGKCKSVCLFIYISLKSPYVNLD